MDFDFQKLWREFPYKSFAAILSKRIENFITFSAFQKQLPSNGKKLNPMQVARHYWQYLEGAKLEDIVNSINCNKSIDCDDVIAKNILDRELSRKLLFLEVPNFNAHLEKTLPVDDKIILELFTTIEVDYFSGKMSKGTPNSGGTLTNLVNRESVSKKKFKDILLEKWEISRSSPSLSKVDLSITFKKCVITLRSLYSYALLLPAYKMYDQRRQFRNSENEIKYRISNSEQNCTLSFDQGEFSRHDFEKIESPFGDISIKVQYRRDLSSIPKPTNPTTTLHTITDGYLIQNSPPQHPAYWNEMKSHSVDDTHSTTMPIAIKQQKNDPTSPHIKSQPRDIPSTRQRSKTIHYTNSLERYGRSPPFSRDGQSMESPIMFGFSGGTPPFTLDQGRNRSSSNSSLKSKPNFGNVTPFDSPHLHSVLSNSNRSLPMNRDSFGTSSYHSKNQANSYEECTYITGMGSLPKGDEDDPLQLGLDIGKSKENLQTLFLKEYNDFDEPPLKQEFEYDLPFAHSDSDEDDESTLLAYFKEPTSLQSLMHLRTSLADSRNSFENIKIEMHRLQKT